VRSRVQGALAPEPQNPQSYDRQRNDPLCDSPTVVRVPFGPTVNHAPRRPMDVDTPDFERFNRRSGRTRKGAAETEVAHAAVSARVGIHGEQPTRWLPRAPAEFTRRPTPCLSAAALRRKTRFARVLDETRDFDRLKRSPMCETQRTMHTANAGSGARLGQYVDTATGPSIRNRRWRLMAGRRRLPAFHAKGRFLTPLQAFGNV
jgi:hypothetical protein